MDVVLPSGSGAWKNPFPDAATLATTVLAAWAGAWAVRVRQVAPPQRAVRVVAATG